jgi:hypothetical protein
VVGEDIVLLLGEPESMRELIDERVNQSIIQSMNG